MAAFGSVAGLAGRSTVVAGRRRGVVGEVAGGDGAAAVVVVVVVVVGGGGGGGRSRRPVVRLGVLAQRRRVRVGLVAAVRAADVRLVGGVDVRVLLAVRAVGEATSAADELAAERTLACTHAHISTARCRPDVIAHKQRSHRPQTTPRCCQMGSYFKRPKSRFMHPLACNWYYCARFIANPKAACALRFSWAVTSSNLAF